MKKSTRRKHYLQRIHRRFAHIENYGIPHKGECPLCGSDLLFYYFRYDAECCLSCDKWLDEPCNDPNCKFCVNRPITPFMALVTEKPQFIDKKDHLRNNYFHKSSGYIRHKNRSVYRDL